MKYEGIVQFLNEIPKSNLYTDPKVITDYNIGIKKYKLAKELMDRLKEEQIKICEASEKRVNLIQPSKNEFRYYIEWEGKIYAVYFAN